MFTRTRTRSDTESFYRLKAELESADAVLIGAGAGLSASAGMAYDGERFKMNFSDFEQKYGFHDMYSGGFQLYETPEEFWAYWSRMIHLNRYEQAAGRAYLDLLEIVKDKDYFVLTTNVDHQFQTAGFDKHRLFYTQGDYGLFQCSHCRKTFDNEESISRMFTQQDNMRIPTELIPKCPDCGKPLTLNLRSDDKFVEDDGWHTASKRYEDYIRRHKKGQILYLELGVGMNTPSIIKYPFWQMTYQNPDAVFVCINLGDAFVPVKIKMRSLCIDADISQTLHRILTARILHLTDSLGPAIPKS